MKVISHHVTFYRYCSEVDDIDNLNKIRVLIMVSMYLNHIMPKKFFSGMVIPILLLVSSQRVPVLCLNTFFYFFFGGRGGEWLFLSLVHKI